MTAKRETILEAVKTALEGISVISDLTVERNRDDSVGSFPMVVVYDSTHERDPFVTGCAKYTMSVPVVLLVRGDSDTLGTALNLLYEEVVKAVVQDATLIGLTAGAVTEMGLVDLERLTDEKRTFDYVTAELMFELEFETAEDDPGA